MDEDFLLALQLQNEFQEEFENGGKVSSPSYRGKENTPVKVNHGSGSLVDPSWELIDPTPDVHALFLQFNDRFFWGKLHSVEVRWSPRMTSCAGVCVYQGKSGFCSVRLSLPLLKLRPRKDLVETLLHEMIHAYLFVTRNNRDRDGHGPEFHKHMYRINDEAGTKITVYHSFHDEVKQYQQHWWRCEGPCQKAPPFFGMVRRSMNRAPGPYDRWWNQHQVTCGGTFKKIREPEGYGKKTTKQPSFATANKGDIRSFFPGPSTSKGSGSSGGWKPSPQPNTARGSGSNKPWSKPKGATIGSGPPKPLSGISSGSAVPTFKKTGEPPSGSNKNPTSTKTPVNNVMGFSDLHGGSDGGLLTPSGSSVNNVFGFKDLSGQTIDRPGRSFPGSFLGKGHTLGGSGSMGQHVPPWGRGHGGFGGMLANKGSGTLVITGKGGRGNAPDRPVYGSQGNVSPSKQMSVKSESTVPVFSGKGHTLGSGSGENSRLLTTPSIKNRFPRDKPNPFQKELPVFVNDETSTSKRSSPDQPKTTGKKSKSSDGDVVMIIDSDDDDDLIALEDISCPVCNKLVKEGDINLHLDKCASAAPKTPLMDVTGEDSKLPMNDSNLVYCPACNKKVIEKEINEHLNNCLASSFTEDDCDDVIFDSSPTKTSDVKCPICGEQMLSSELDVHLENCAHCSVQDLSEVFSVDDFSEDEEEDAAVGSPSRRVADSGERLYPCPCCMALQEESRMNDHLDMCIPP